MHSRRTLVAIVAAFVAGAIGCAAHAQAYVRTSGRVGYLAIEPKCQVDPDKSIHLFVKTKFPTQEAISTPAELMFMVDCEKRNNWVCRVVVVPFAWNGEGGWVITPPQIVDEATVLHVTKNRAVIEYSQGDTITFVNSNGDRTITYSHLNKKTGEIIDVKNDCQDLPY